MYRELNRVADEPRAGDGDLYRSAKIVLDLAGPRPGGTVHFAGNQVTARSTG